MACEADRHSREALRLFNEANKLLRRSENACSVAEHLDLMEQIIRKDDEAIAEIEEAIKCQNEFMDLQKEFLTAPPQARFGIYLAG